MPLESTRRNRSPKTHSRLSRGAPRWYLDLVSTSDTSDEQTAVRRAAWEKDGYFIVRGFASAETCARQRASAVEIAKREAAGSSIRPSYLLKEERLVTEDRLPEEQISKIFNLHQERDVFHEFCRTPRLLDLVRKVLGDDLDCFLSQFIFKYEGSLGQPWHQDSWYFPFDRGPQVGVWLAITESTMENGPLWVLPGSHTEPIHEVVKDRRKGATLGYVEIVDHDMSDAIPVLMQPGDLLVFHSHLMHKSTDHAGGDLRAAMVFHYAEAGTTDHTLEKWGFKSPNNDFRPVLRGGRAVPS